MVPGDFNACHRIEKKEDIKIRPILVKFVRRNHARSLKTRAKQRYDKTRMLVNEDLTSSRATAARDARVLVKITKSYAYSRNFFIETNDLDDNTLNT